MADEIAQHWTVDKRIPLALIIMLMVNFGVGIWWMAKQDSRISNLEAFNAIIAESRPINLNRITILEQQSQFIKESLQRIESNQNRRATP